MAPSRRAHCSRCAREVVAIGAWPGFRWVKRGWYAGLLVLTAIMPVILSEITILLPMALVFAAAAGPVHALAARKPTCGDCGAEVSFAREPRA